MIKIKLNNWDKGRNQTTFRTFIMYHNQFNDIGVQFTQEGSYDFEFIGMEDFINKKIPLKDSIDYGLDILSNKTGDYYLFDGSDSTSLMGAYEVFQDSNSQYLFKTSKLEQKQYNTPTAFGKWFFGEGSDLDLFYDIPDSLYEDIKLTGWNLGYYHPEYLDFTPINTKKDIDVCAIFQANHKENYDHKVRNDLFYTNHRASIWDILDSQININYVKDKRPYPEFVETIKRSKCVLSPYGMGEICFRDFEIIRFGSIMIKPDMSKVITHPNIYIPYETYIPCALDWSDLIEKINWVKDNPKQCKEIIENARRIMKESYTIENLLLYWYNMISTFKGIEL